MGLHIDASSGFEVYRAIDAGFQPNHISLSSQARPRGMACGASASISLSLSPLFPCALRRQRSGGDTTSPHHSGHPSCTINPTPTPPCPLRVRQELPSFFPDLVKQGVLINACSLRQLDLFGQAFPGGEARTGAPRTPLRTRIRDADVEGGAEMGLRGAQIGLRINPGAGSGGTGKTNVGGPSSSFGALATPSPTPPPPESLPLPPSRAA